MYRYITFSYFLFTSGSMALVDVMNRYSLDINQCVDICSDSFFLLPKDEESQNNCQRGCRFANIIDLTGKRNLNDTSNDCQKSCVQSYIKIKSKNSCIIGCNAVTKKKQSEIHYIFPYLEQYTINEQEFDSIENDFFLDPLIRQQLQQSINIKYKIPEAYIRTLPIDNDFNFITGVPYKYYKSNTICSSVISFTIFGAVLIGFLVCIIKIIQSMQAIETRVQLLTSDVDDVNDLNCTKNTTGTDKNIDEKNNDFSAQSILV